jgi:transcriptional regulator
MYINATNHFPTPDDLLATIEDYPFGALIAPGDPPIATHMPFVLERTAGEYGTLLCHTPRHDPVWRQFDGKTEMLVIFTGPFAYISPRWYVDGARVPTYNFKAVHAYGRPEVMRYEGDVVTMLRTLIERHEQRFGSGFGFDEIPQAVFDGLRPAIVPFRMRIERLEGKIRVGQNRTSRDRRSVVEGLRARGHDYDARVAEMMESGPVDPSAPRPLVADIPSDIIGGRAKR